jgi:hypothetical protein
MSVAVGHSVPRDLAWRNTVTFKLIIIAGVLLTVAACVEGPPYYSRGGYNSNGSYGGDYYASRGYGGDGQHGYYGAYEGHGDSGGWDRD